MYVLLDKMPTAYRGEKKLTFTIMYYRNKVIQKWRLTIPITIGSYVWIHELYAYIMS